MSTNRNRKKGRKRKQPDSFTEDPPSQPRSKKRKISHPPHNKLKTTNDKSQSTSPKISKPNPFNNTNIPTAFNNNSKSKLSRRHTYSNDSTPNSSEDNLSSPDSSSPIHYNPQLLSKYNTIRSQPSTPNNNRKNKEPHSQSAKRSKTHRKFTIKPSNNNNNNNTNNTYNIRDTSLSPPPAIRKSIPLLFESQDSVAFSPPQNKPKMSYMNVQITHKTPPRDRARNNTNQSYTIPVAATPQRTTYNTLQMENINANVNNNSNRSNNDTMANNNSQAANNKDSIQWNKDLWYIILLLLIGFAVGGFVAGAVFSSDTNGYPKATTMNNRFNIIDSNVCTCDIETNTSSRLCNPCMDQYWELKSECDSINNQQLEQERDALILEKERLENELMNLRNGHVSDGCVKRLNNLENEMNQCKNMKIELENEMEQLKNNKVNCDKYKDEIGELQHELGECNVEWGACKQVGRQKDKLDEKRVEEIQNQKKKFRLCNEQLKRYKEKAKKNKGR